jgi:metal-sulfur cluster biosynthetic enzyme
MTNAAETKKLTWDIETTHPDLVEPVKDALRQIMDPEIGLSIIQLGLIRNVTIHDGAAVIKMLLTTPFCPYGPALIESAKEKAASVLNMDTRIDLSMEMWDFSMMEDGLGDDWGLYT